MILDKKTQVIINGSNLKHFRLLGYKDIKCGDKLDVFIDELLSSCKNIIKVKCDVCGKEKQISYFSYTRNIKKYNFYTCSKCATIKAKKTNIEKYSDENYCNKEKIKRTNLSNYGVENIFQSKIIKEKIKQDNLHNYGVENPMQIRKFFEKQQKKCFLLKLHKNTNLYYRGNYEKDFLDFCYNNKIKIEKGKRFEYFIDNQKHYYFSDYYVKSHNLIVEIKSDWTYNNNLEINKLKEKSALNSGYDYLFLIDKDYNEFKDKLKIN